MIEEGPPATLGATRRRVRVRVDPGDAGAAARLLSRWPTIRAADAGPEFTVEHGSGRDVNAALATGGVIAESVATEQPGLEDRFLELTRAAAREREENDHDVAAAG